MTQPTLQRGATMLITSLVASFVIACSGAESDGSIVLGSTTSVHDTGLLDELVPAFQRDHPGYRVKVLAVGSGEALALGRRRDVDLVLVHSPQAEQRFVEEGHGVRRSAFMNNDFFIVGPPADPAGARGADVYEALRRIAATRSRFLSRGDDSGTHHRELELWRAAGITPAGPWYEQVGQGMAATLLVAGEREAYLLTDRATHVSLAGRTGLAVIVAGGDPLYNEYSTIEVSGSAHPHGACLLSRWLRNRSALGMIAEFGHDRFGSPLFQPLRKSTVDESPAEARVACDTSVERR